MQTTEPQALYLIGAAPIDPRGKDVSMPPSTFDETYKPRPVGCKQCGWIYGVVMRVKLSTNNRQSKETLIRRLWVFTDAIAEESLPPISVLRSNQRNIYRVHGLDQCDGIECGHCGCRNKWDMSMESYLRMTSYYQRGDD